MSQLHLEDGPKAQLEAEIGAINSYKVASIISLLFCCPLGIAAVICAFLTENAKNAMDYKKASSLSTATLVLMILSYVFGVLAIFAKLMGR